MTDFEFILITFGYWFIVLGAIGAFVTAPSKRKKGGKKNV